MGAQIEQKTSWIASTSSFGLLVEVRWHLWLLVDKSAVLPVFVDGAFCIDPEDDPVLMIFNFDVYGWIATDRNHFAERLARKLELDCPRLHHYSHWLWRCVTEVNGTALLHLDA
jgi:hypothetical protein